MRFIYIGDVVGRTGRKAVVENLAELRRRLDLDFVVLNGENAAHGFGITRKICQEFYAAGVDVITTGNHAFDNKDILPALGEDKQFIRPLNLAEGSPGRGAWLYDLADGRKVLVAQVIGRLFMKDYGDPFQAIDKELDGLALGSGADCIIVDFHAEATSEKMAMGHYLDGRASLVVGSHTHVPSADHHILGGGTAYITDIGMCGDYDSVIGMKKDGAIERFTNADCAERLEPAKGEATLCAVVVETDPQTGLAKTIEPLRLGGSLAPVWPGAGG